MADEAPEIRHLTMEQLRIAHTVLAEVFKDDPEPIPRWEQGDPASLATCRACTEVEAYGVRKYPDVPSAAAKLFYSCIKLHAFPNGNKRFALVVALYFAIINGYRLTAPEGMSVEVAEAVAESDPHDPATSPDAVIGTLTIFYRENMEKQPPDDPGPGIGSH